MDILLHVLKEINMHVTNTVKRANIVKSGNFGHQVNSDSDIVCFIF